MDSGRQNPFDSQPTPGMAPLVTFGSARVQHKVGSVMPAVSETPPRVTHSSADRELLIENVLEAVRTPEHYSRTVAGKRVGIYVMGYASGGISQGRKDISAGESGSQGGRLH